MIRKSIEMVSNTKIKLLTFFQASEKRLLMASVYLNIILLNIITFTLPPIVSTDGHLYVISGHVLFTKDMFEYYQWFREPLYPVIISILQKLSLNIAALIAVQTTILVITVHLLILLAWRITQKVSGNLLQPIPTKFIILSTFVISYLFHGYAISILQQVWFAFFASWLLFVIFHSRSIKPRILYTTLSIHGLMFSLFARSFFYSISVWLIIIAAYFFITKVDSRQVLIRAVTAFLLVGSVSNLVWSSYKDVMQIPVAGPYGTNESFDRLNFFSDKSLAGQVSQTSRTYFALLNLVPEYYEGIEVYGGGVTSGENKTFALPVFTAEQLCGRYYQGPLYFKDDLQAFYDKGCSLPLRVSIGNQLNQKLTILFPLSGIIFLTFCIYALISRKILLILTFLLPNSIFLPYLYFGLGISRYGSFSIPISLSFFLVYARKLWLLYLKPITD